MTDTTTPVWRRRAGAAGLVTSGLLLGGVLTGTIAANAATDSPTATPDSTATLEEPGAGKSAQPQRSDETPVTGDTLTRVTDAVLAEYPDATIERVETDAGGGYEAHIVTADGERLRVAVDESFTVTGTSVGGAPCGPGGRGPGDRGDGPAGRVPSAPSEEAPPGVAPPGLAPSAPSEQAPTAPSEEAPTTSYSAA